MKQMQFSAKILASKDQAWRTLWRDETFRQWASIIDPGTYMVGELKEGGLVQFISSESGYGVTSLVERLVPGEFLLLKHCADTQDSGRRERDNEWTGGQESYRLTADGDVTTLSVTIDIPPELEDGLKASYPKALERVKLLAESKA